MVQLFAVDRSFPAEVQRANYDYFVRTATLDLLDTSHATVGGTFIGGVHTAANAGAYQTAVFGFGGLDVGGSTLVVRPHLPPDWTALEFTVVFRGRRLRVRATPETTTVQSVEGNNAPVDVHVADGTGAATLVPGESIAAWGAPVLHWKQIAAAQPSTRATTRA